MQVMDEDTRKLLGNAGCRENDEGRLLFYEELVQKALSSVPGRMVIYDRNVNVAVATVDAVPRLSPRLNCINVLDYKTREHRLCLLKDIVKAAKLCESLPNIDLAAGLGNHSDIPASQQAMETIKALTAGTGKPLAFIAHDEVEDEHIWNYLSDVAGGWEALSSKPFPVDLTGPYFPLKLGKEACRRLRFAARNRLPVACYTAIR